MKRSEEVELAVLCLVYDEEKILVQDRKKTDWMGVVLPGGHVERNESFVNAVIREIKEETGLTIKNPVLCGIKQFPIDGGRYFIALYKTNNFEGELTASEEGQVMWVKREDLNNYNLVEDFHQLLKVFDEESLSEFQYVINDGQWVAEIR